MSGAQTTRLTNVTPPLQPGAEMEAVYALWDGLNRFPADDTDSALKQLCQRLRSLLKADNVKWLAAVRVVKGARSKSDSLQGWRLRASYDLVPDPESYQRLIRCMFESRDPSDTDFLIGLATAALIARAGTFQVHRLRDGWIPYRQFARSEHFRIHYTELGITDRIWISFPLNADAESIFLIDRTGSSPRFSPREATLAATILRAAGSFQRRLFLDRGLLIGDQPLSPVSRRIVQKLLTGRSEKEIAEAMDQSLTTTHKYIKNIYARFGVNGRAALMSLWLGA